MNQPASTDIALAQNRVRAMGLTIQHTPHAPTMSNTPTDLIQALIDHADYQISTRNVTLSKQEEAVQKEKRRELMAAIVDALGLEPKAIQEKLGVNRTTWSRWESMESAPNKSHLQHLRRILEARHSNPPVPSPAKGLPQRPVDFLLKSPFTFSRIRLLFSVYPWKDAVLHFRKPFWTPTRRRHGITRPSTAAGSSTS